MLLIIAVVPVFAVPGGEPVAGCPPPFGEPTVGGGATDRNGDGFVCVTVVGDGGQRIGMKMTVDNNVRLK